MKKNDKLTLITFIILIISIIIVVGINGYKNKKLENVDRKIEYILGYTYNSIMNKGETLFLQTIDFYKNEDIFEYDKNLDESIKQYSINGIHNYKKIKNFSIVLNNFSIDSLKDYMEYKNIINYENSYYINDEKLDNNNYIGSIIELVDYNNNEVNFKSKNFYCDNNEYIGILNEEPKCNYDSFETKFTIVLENNIFKIKNIDDFKLIIK